MVTLNAEKEEKADDSGHFLPHFGIDESGKGDFFGPLVVAGVYTDTEITRHLMKSGVMDSKRITTPAAIRKLSAIIKATPGIQFDIIAIRPERYNEIYGSFKNLNKMLAWGHATVIEELAKKSLAARARSPINSPTQISSRPL